MGSGEVPLRRHPCSAVGPAGQSTLPGRAQRVAAASGKGAKRYMQREHLLEIGREALEQLAELNHRRPRVWIRDVGRLQELLRRHGEEVLAAALRARRRGRAGTPSRRSPRARRQSRPRRCARASLL
jgi:hypothetical protein